MNSVKTGVDKRTHPRISCDIPAQVRNIDGSPDAKSLTEMRVADQKAQVKNLSLGGLLLETMEKLSHGNILRLEIPLPEGRVTAFAEVCWTGETNCGLRFLAVKEEDAEVIRKYLKSLPGY